MELTITKEKVIEAASKCSQAKEILKTLFPEVFKKSNEVDLTELSFHEINIGRDLRDTAWIRLKQVPVLTVNFTNPTRFTLSDSFKWEIDGHFLIPTRKP